MGFGGITHAVFGRSGDEVVKRVGHLAQLARIEHFTESEGAGRGTRRMRVTTGGGLEFDVLPDRSLDLGFVTFRGVPIAWHSPVGMVAPQLAESRDTEWLRSFSGGMLATCGLDTFGPPSTDEGKHFPMHGAIGVTPATVTRAEISSGTIRISAEIRQARVFGENLLLQRTISADVGGSALTIEDTVTNESERTEGHMLLYHFNFGWPLLDECATLEIDSHSLVPRDAAATAGVDRWHQIEAPQTGFAEQVFLHDVSGSEGKASIDNPELDVRCNLTFDAQSLPALHQWKMSGVGHYVMGLEPANTLQIHGRAAAKRANMLPTLAPGESRSYRLTLSFDRSQKGAA